MIAPFSYADRAVPAGYVCSKCKAHGCKLWRGYMGIDGIELLCGVCTLARTKKRGVINADGKRRSSFGMTDQIGDFVPAVPTEDGADFWGYTSAPDAGVRWWKALPTAPELT